jgi:hypothetical protein
MAKSYNQNNVLDGGKMKSLRRSIIVICLLLLAPIMISDISYLGNGKYYSTELKTLVKNGKADVIEVNKKIKLDSDTIYIERIINTDEETSIRYRIVEKQGWTFSNSALALYDESGKKQMRGSTGHGTFWGESGIISYDRIDKDSKKITIELEWYDRTGEVVIPIAKGGMSK